MSEFPKFVPKEGVVGSIQFREIDPDSEYVEVEQPFRGRVIRLTPAPELSLVSVDFLSDSLIKEGDVRELIVESDMDLRDDAEHNLASILIDNGIMPITSFDILGSNRVYAKVDVQDDEQPDPTQPMSHLRDYFPAGIPTKRGSRKTKNK